MLETSQEGTNNLETSNSMEVSMEDVEEGEIAGVDLNKPDIGLIVPNSGLSKFKLHKVLSL